MENRNWMTVMKTMAKTEARWNRVYAMSLASVYPMYVAKAEKRGAQRLKSTKSFAG